MAIMSFTIKLPYYSAVTVKTAVSVVTTLPGPLVITQRYFWPSLAAVTGTLNVDVPFPFMDEVLQTLELALQYCH